MVENSTGKILSRRMRLLLGTLFALSLADALITRFIVESGAGFETNPVLRPLVQDPNFYWVKVFGTTIAVMLLWHLYVHYQKRAVRLTAFCVGFYVIVVWWNTAVAVIGSVI